MKKINHSWNSRESVPTTPQSRATTSNRSAMHNLTLLNFQKDTYPLPIKSHYRRSSCVEQYLATERVRISYLTQTKCFRSLSLVLYFVFLQWSRIRKQKRTPQNKPRWRANVKVHSSRFTSAGLIFIPVWHPHHLPCDDNHSHVTLESGDLWYVPNRSIFDGHFPKQ